MSRYIKREDAIKTVYKLREHFKCWDRDDDIAIKNALNAIPPADVRENIHAKKVIGGGEHDGATCWIECSSCHGAVDAKDTYCKHCGAKFVLLFTE